MTKIVYNREKVNDIISNDIDNLINKFDAIKSEFNPSSIPSEFPYYDYLLSLNDNIDNYKNIFNNLSDGLKNLDIELVNFEDTMFQNLNKIEDKQ